MPRRPSLFEPPPPFAPGPTAAPGPRKRTDEGGEGASSLPPVGPVADHRPPVADAPPVGTAAPRSATLGRGSARDGQPAATPPAAPGAGTPAIRWRPTMLGFDDDGLRRGPAGPATATAGVEPLVPDAGGDDRRGSAGTGRPVLPEDREIATVVPMAMLPPPAPLLPIASPSRPRSVVAGAGRREDTRPATTTPPPVRVTIGRVEVRVVQPPATTVPGPAPAPTRISRLQSLDEYLRHGSGGER